MSSRALLMVVVAVVCCIAMFALTCPALETTSWTRTPRALEEKPAVMWEARGEEFVLQAFMLLAVTSASAIIVRERGGGRP